MLMSFVFGLGSSVFGLLSWVLCLLSFQTILKEEFVADAPDGLNKLMGGIFDLAAQPSHMDIDGSGPAVIFIAPDLAEKGVSGEDLPGICGQKFQQFIFLKGEIDPPAVDHDFIPFEVDHEAPMLDRLFSGDPAVFPQDEPDAGQKF